MITYEVRRRVFRTRGADAPSFPAEVRYCVVLGPPQPFGGEGYGRSVVTGGKAKIRFDANAGRHQIESEPRLGPLAVSMEIGDKRFGLNGQELRVSGPYASLEELHDEIQSLVMVLPWALNVEFADPPHFERVSGEISGVRFTWELESWEEQVDWTTPELQAERFRTSLKRLTVLAEPGRRRLVAALHYFHRSCRLERTSATPGEFMAEELLNYCKILEVLFPGEKGQKSMDASRQGLSELGFSENEIELEYIPVIALRNHLDVGHVYLGVFNDKQLTTLHEYGGAAKRAFRRLFERVFERIEDGTWDIVPYDIGKPRSSVANIIERLAKPRAIRQEAQRDCDSRRTI